MHLHLPVAVLLPPESCFSLSQPLLQRFESLRMHAAPFCVVLHKSENITRLIISKSIHKKLDSISYSNVVTGHTLAFPSVPHLMQHSGTSAADQLHQAWFSGLQVDRLWQRGLLWGHQPVTEIPVTFDQSETALRSICLPGDASGLTLHEKTTT